MPRCSSPDRAPTRSPCPAATGLRMVRLDGGAPTGGIEIAERVNRSGARAAARRTPSCSARLRARCLVRGGQGLLRRQLRTRAAGPDRHHRQRQRDPAARRRRLPRQPRRPRPQRPRQRLAPGTSSSDKQKIDNWDALIPPPQRDEDNKKKDKNLVDDAVAQQPPTAKPDNLTVRPGARASSTSSTTTPTPPAPCSRSTRAT